MDGSPRNDEADQKLRTIKKMSALGGALALLQSASIASDF
jgi:hypothetical protein